MYNMCLFGTVFTKKQTRTDRFNGKAQTHPKQQNEKGTGTRVIIMSLDTIFFKDVLRHYFLSN